MKKAKKKSASVTEVVKVPPTVVLPIVTKAQFEEIVVAHLVKEYEEPIMANLFERLLADGLPKIDWDYFDKWIGSLHLYLPSMAVDVDDPHWFWVVNGNQAMLVHKDNHVKYEELFPKVKPI